jgi:hypothetical protein
VFSGLVVDMRKGESFVGAVDVKGVRGVVVKVREVGVRSVVVWGDC